MINLIHRFTDFSIDIASVWVFPSGLVIISSGSFRQLIKNNDELAALYGHTLGHQVARHTQESISIPLTSLIVVGSLSPALILLMFRFPKKMLKYFFVSASASWIVSRVMFHVREREADHIGLLLMADAGFDPAGATRYWKNQIELERKQQQRTRGIPHTQPRWPHGSVSPHYFPCRL